MLTTPSKLIHNWRCYPSSKCCKINQKHGSELGVLLWRHLTPQGKTVIWVHNYTPSGVQLPQSYSGKLTSCMTFDADKHVRSEPFLDYLYEVWHLLLAPCSDMWPKPLRWNFIKIFLLSIRSGEHKLFRRFFDFAIFNRNFAKTVALPSKKWELSNPSERAILFEKTLKTASKSTNKQRHKICSNPSNEQRAGQVSEREKKTDIQTPHFRTYSRRALFDRAQTLHGGRARRVHPKR